jgi:hypothetical protein
MDLTYMGQMRKVNFWRENWWGAEFDRKKKTYKVRVGLDSDRSGQNQMVASNF